jgi:hypothetical protein
MGQEKSNEIEIGEEIPAKMQMQSLFSSLPRGGWERLSSLFGSLEGQTRAQRNEDPKLCPKENLQNASNL